MWWPAVGGYYVRALCSYLFDNVSFLSYFLTLTLPVIGFAILQATLVSELVLI